MKPTSKKMGRPKLENPTAIRHCIRLDKQLNDRLSDYCKAHGVSMGETTRAAIRAFLDVHEGK
ncbi:MAG: CopG family transcriptional regulator [Streptococcus salivarius]|nr:CopG family transcriptional regulator [Streptococcus salivarius]